MIDAVVVNPIPNGGTQVYAIQLTVGDKHGYNDEERAAIEAQITRRFDCFCFVVRPEDVEEFIADRKDKRKKFDENSNVCVAGFC